MWHKETRQEVKTVDTTVREWCTCDMCGKEIKGDRFDVQEGEVKLSEGSSYPEGGIVDVLSADLCPACFKDRLVPWLESQGVKLQKERREW